MQILKKLFIEDKIESPKIPTLEEEIEVALSDMNHCRKQIDFADNDMIDVAILNFNATQERYQALLRRKKAS